MLRRLLAALAVPVLFGAAAARADLAGEFKRIGLDIGTQIATDPADFLFDTHLNSEDRTPLPVDKSWQLGTNIFPALLPFGRLGLDGKTRLHREHGDWPQIQIGWGYWNFLPAGIASTTEFDISLSGWHLGVQAAVSVDPRLRLFLGYEFSQMRVDADIKFDTAGKTGTDLNVMNAFSSLHTGKTEHFLFMGGELLRSPTKRLVAELGYGLVSSKLIARITWASKYFDNGISFYPEGAFAFWPFWNFQVRW